MMKVGITGGIGSRKSTVCRLFARFDVAVYDSDAGAKRLMTEDAELRRRITDRFGAEAYADGTLNRTYLAGRVFSEAQALADLNAIVHPAVRADNAAWAEQQEGDYVILASALLFDAVFDACVDRTVAVLAPEALRIERTCRRDGRTPGEVRLRIAAQTAKQVIIQGIREAERGMIFESFSSKEHEILTGSVLRFEPNGDMTIRIGQGTDKTDALLPVGEQVKTEHFVEGDMIRVYVIEVRRSSRGPQVMVSRTHPALVTRLFELEVPEVRSGAVEVRSIAREPGSRTKIAVHAAEENIDPVGACVGARGARVGAVVEELQGEKMDIVVWSEDFCQFVASALSPADVISVTQLQQGAKACRVIVPDDQLSLAIGKEGQNARLAARLTGYKIDIKPESYHDEEEPPAGGAPEAADTAEASAVEPVDAE